MTGDTTAEREHGQCIPVEAANRLLADARARHEATAADRDEARALLAAATEAIRAAISDVEDPGQGWIACLREHLTAALAALDTQVKA